MLFYFLGCTFASYQLKLAHSSEYIKTENNNYVTLGNRESADSLEIIPSSKGTEDDKIIIAKNKNNKVWDIAGNVSDLILYGKHEGENQRFNFENINETVFVIKNKDKCLEYSQSHKKFKRKSCNYEEKNQRFIKLKDSEKDKTISYVSAEELKAEDDKQEEKSDDENESSNNNNNNSNNNNNNNFNKQNNGNNCCNDGCCCEKSIQKENYLPNIQYVIYEDQQNCKSDCCCNCKQPKIVHKKPVLKKVKPIIVPIEPEKKTTTIIEKIEPPKNAIVLGNKKNNDNDGLNNSNKPVFDDGDYEPTLDDDDYDDNMNNGSNNSNGGESSGSNGGGSGNSLPSSIEKGIKDAINDRLGGNILNGLTNSVETSWAVLEVSWAVLVILWVALVILWAYPVVDYWMDLEI
ncbi:MAG: hypothetical protein RR549_02475 [Oscillospiraceae bacterium]